MDTPILILPLPLFLSEKLHHLPHIDIEPQTARLIMALDGWKEYCYIQLNDRYGHALRYPRLWNLHAWRTDTESWLLAKKRQDDDRIKHFLYKANVIGLKNKIRRMFDMIEPEHAELLAQRWLTNHEDKKILSVGYTLKTKEEEL